MSSFQAIGDAFANLFNVTGNVIQQVPGMTIVVQYIRNSYQDDPARILLELLFFTYALYYLLKKDDKKNTEKLTKEEVDLLVEEWKPEPLVPPETTKYIDNVFVGEIAGQSNLNVTLTTGESLQNWATTNFLGLQNSKDITNNAIATVRKYGVGTCGPAGFYGSMDVHLELEKQLAKILEVDAALVYSQGFMAVASVIPAFCKRGDIIVADSGVSFAAQTGLEISRSQVYFFEHNNMADLEAVLERINADCIKKKLPLSRRFIVVEGLYAKWGDKCPLPEILEIKKKYKYRLLVDESLSLGAIGKRGLGISDYYGVPAREIDIITGAFNNALGSSGGFCAGSTHVIEHQVLSSQAYCFSATLPAMFATTTSLTLNQILEKPSLMQDLAKNIRKFNSIMEKGLPKRFVIVGDADCPIKFVRLSIRHEDPNNEACLMNSLVKEMKERGYLITRDRHVQSKEKFIPPPSVKIYISAGFTEVETESFAKALLSSLQALL